MESQTEQQKYEKYFFRDVVTGAMKEEWGGEMIGLGGIKSDVIPADAHMSLGVTAVRKPYMFHETLHKHLFTEYFYFFGSNPYDMDEFDAEVEFYFGAEKEKYLIS